MSCFCALLAGKRKNPKITNKFAYARKASGNDCPKVKPVEFVEKTDTVAVVRGSDDVVQACDKKATAFRATGLAWQGRDEDRDKATLKRDMADVDVVAGGADSSGYSSDGVDKDTSSGAPEASESSAGPVVAPAASSRLERSCSNIETARSGSNNAFDLPAKSLSYGDLKALPAGRATSTGVKPGASPTASVRTSYSADHVMLKKRSSSQVLPSRSRKLWWRLFMWSHRNLHRPGAAIPALPSADTDDVPHHHDGGYTSDTLGAGTATADAKKKAIAVEQDPIPNQWVAFSAEASSLDRVSAWVNSLGDGSFQADEEDIAESHDDGEHCTEITELSAVVGKSHAQARRRAPGEAIKTDSIIQTLNAFSSVAHISGMGLNAVPMISAFSSLRAVNLSGNFIVCISPGSLPKGLHSLDLSRNRIATIEGLRELTRLRVLNLSYNRIPRFGHGLSSCTSIRELYIAGNKMSDVEGLHRLLKLAVLDLSFNKITTTKALGQLVANYNSLRALNLLGNPVQANMGDDALRKAVSGLLPRMEYLNKQAVKPQRAREAAKDSVAKAALGNGGWSSRKRASRRLSQSPGSLAIAKSRGREGSRSRSRPQGQGSSNLARI